MPVVEETGDAYCSDILGLHATDDVALKAISTYRTGLLDEGNMGGGARVVCYQRKAGAG